jgi:uncharacterized protein (DUF488 family)
VSVNTSEVGQRILTIGHSNHPLDKFLSLLTAHSVEVLVDIRSHPYSKHAPHFNVQTLKEAVTGAGIQYQFLGEELGGRPKGEEFYDADGYVLYSRVAEAPFFLEGISRLETGIQQYRVAMMCSEENPVGCHRRLLVGRVLTARRTKVYHLRGNGRVQTEAELATEEMNRNSGDDQLALFGSQGANTWKSIRSVLRREKQPRSSEH